jgi:hypothetical protein
MKGVITTRNLRQADQIWPGIREFYYAFPVYFRPRMFLSLLWIYLETQAEKGEDHDAA